MQNLPAEKHRRLSFDQFHELRKRSRQNSLSLETNSHLLEDVSNSDNSSLKKSLSLTCSPTSIPSSTTKTNSSSSFSSNNYVPVTNPLPNVLFLQILERYDMQLMLIGLLAIDFLAVVIEILFAVQISEKTQFVLLYHLLQQFTSFTGILFVLELSLLAFAYGKQFFQHPGYLLDFFVVTFSLIWEFQMQSKVLRLLGVLRIWRVIRLVHKMVDPIQRQLQEQILLVAKANRNTEKALLEKTIVEETLKKELESKLKIEQMLQIYKDEVETLKEALSIAAWSVAQAGVEENKLQQNLSKKERPIQEVLEN